MNQLPGDSRPSAGAEHLVAAVDRALTQLGAQPGHGIVVAFSGGLDSTALLSALHHSRALRGLRILAAHADHGLDASSRRRAEQARTLARGMGVQVVVNRLDLGPLRADGASVEAAARQARYAWLEELRRATGSAYIATAHHREDQAETVLLRLLFGSGLEGLAGIRPRHERVIRPLLDLPRQALRGAVAAWRLEPIEDPTNADTAIPRNHVRLELMPHLMRGTKLEPADLVRLSEAARRAFARVAARLDERLEPRRIDDGIAISRAAFSALPVPLQEPALALLHRMAGAPYPASRRARTELRRQLASGLGVGCDCGAGWRWEGSARDLLLRRPAEPAAEPVSDS